MYVPKVYEMQFEFQSQLKEPSLESQVTKENLKAQVDWIQLERTQEVLKLCKMPINLMIGQVNANQFVSDFD